MTTRNAIESVKRQLDHGCDGPITSFVLIARATALAASGKVPSETVANALYECLDEFHWLVGEGEMHETGS